MIAKRKVIVSNSYNPYFNLALEELLLNTVEKHEIIMYLWRNQNTVVIGRNQNPWKECNLEVLSRNKGKLARRLSGGGAVYHDLGNLNFTFLMSDENEDLSKQLSVIIKALEELGVKAGFSGRNDILVQNKKISGNAFYREEDKYYHHGTLLFDVDMEVLPTILTPSIEKLESKGIDSVKSRVTNLKGCKEGLTIDKLKEALIEAFKYNYGKIDNTQYVDEGSVSMENLILKYSSEEWVYGDCPSFDVSMDKLFKEGKIEINLKTEEGKINQCKIYTDSLMTREFTVIENLLKGCNFNKVDILEKLENANESFPKGEINVLTMVKEIIEDTMI
ncbi:lipoate--protein ligase [Clostridium sp.]|uniref:lipoate--protein ligase n=1 Tax=Clostridium sp. TaxID=1506 RepID=UPI002FC90BBD